MLSLRGDWVFPVAGPPLGNAAVTISQGRIVAVGRPPHGVPCQDLGRAAIVPGLINAHAHLEFSDLAAPIGRPGMGLVEWLQSVMGHRAAAPGCKISPVAQGLQQSVGYGVAAIGEIVQPGAAFDPYFASPCRGTLFLELIAPRIERVDAALEAARKYVIEARSASERNPKCKRETGPKHRQPLALRAKPPCPVHGSSAIARPRRESLQRARVAAGHAPGRVPRRDRVLARRPRAVSQLVGSARRVGTPPRGPAAAARWTSFGRCRLPTGPSWSTATISMRKRSSSWAGSGNEWPWFTAPGRTPGSVTIAIRWRRCWPRAWWSPWAPTAGPHRPTSTCWPRCGTSPASFLP